MLKYLTVIMLLIWLFIAQCPIFVDSNIGNTENTVLTGSSKKGVVLKENPKTFTYTLVVNKSSKTIATNKIFNDLLTLNISWSHKLNLLLVVGLCFGFLIELLYLFIWISELHKIVNKDANNHDIEAAKIKPETNFIKIQPRLLQV